MNADRIGRITVTGSVTEYALPRTCAFPALITADACEEPGVMPQGSSDARNSAVWFMVNRGNAVGGSS
jgi:virginiamycin B lyase